MTAASISSSGVLARALERDALGNGGLDLARLQLATVEAPLHRRCGAALHPQDLHLRSQCLDRRRHTRDETAAADGDHHRIEVGDLVEDLESHRPLTSDDFRILEGVDKGEVVLVTQLVGVSQHLIEALSVELDTGPQLAGAGDFDQRCGLGHHDQRLGADRGGGVGDTLRMVAGRGGDHPALPFLRCQTEQTVDGTPRLEGARPLQGLVFEVKLDAAQLGQDLRLEAGGLFDRPGDAAAGLLDVCELYHGRSPKRVTESL
jgi:hypothetical protein